MKSIKLPTAIETYKGYTIENGICGIEVFYCGDDIIFGSVEEAKAFIDEIAE